MLAVSGGDAGSGEQIDVLRLRQRADHGLKLRVGQEWTQAGQFTRQRVIRRWMGRHFDPFRGEVNLNFFELDSCLPFLEQLCGLVQGVRSVAGDELACGGIVNGRGAFGESDTEFAQPVFGVVGAVEIGRQFKSPGFEFAGCFWGSRGGRLNAQGADGKASEGGEKQSGGDEGRVEARGDWTLL